MGVVGDDKGDAGLLVDAQEAGRSSRLFGEGMILEFQEEIAFAHNGEHAESIGLRAVVIAGKDPPGDSPGDAGRKGDKAFVVFLEQVEIDARAVIEAVHVSGGDQFAEIVITGLVFAQKDQVGRFPVQIVGLVKAGAWGHIDFAADDGLDPGFFGGAVKIDHAEHGAVIGDGAGRLAQLLQPFHQTLDPAGAVQETVFGMNVQVHESFGHPPAPPFRHPAARVFLSLFYNNSGRVSTFLLPGEEKPGLPRARVRGYGQTVEETPERDLFFGRFYCPRAQKKC